MRVTDRMFTDRSLASLQDRRREYLDAQTQATSGRRATKPSDDPIAMARVRTHQQTARRAKDYERAASLVESRLQVVDGALGEAQSLMARAREVAVQANNSVLSASDRQALAAEVDALSGHLDTVVRTQMGTTYLFSGEREDVAPFNPGGAWNGSPNVQEVEVAPNVRVALGVTGQIAFTDAINSLSDLQTALAANDTAGLQQSLTSIGAASDIVSDSRATVGSQLVTVDMATSLNSRWEYQAEEAINREVGADAFTAYTELTQAQSALAAAVEIVGQLPLPGLASR